MILRMLAEVIGEVVDARRKERDLDGSAATIVLVELVLRYDFVLVGDHVGPPPRKVFANEEAKAPLCALSYVIAPKFSGFIGLGQPVGGGFFTGDRGGRGDGFWAPHGPDHWRGHEGSQPARPWPARVRLFCVPFF